MEYALNASSQLEIAMNLAKDGYRVFPCHSLGKPKTPYVKWKEESTTDTEIIQKWWEKWSSALVGVPTGVVNGFTVLDIDKKNDVDGFKSLHRLGFDLDSICGPRIKTPSGGLHIYFHYCPSVKNSAGKLGPGLDIRNDGGYVIVAGEIPELGRYEVLTS